MFPVPARAALRSLEARLLFFDQRSAGRASCSFFQPFGSSAGRLAGRGRAVFVRLDVSWAWTLTFLLSEKKSKTKEEL